MSEPSSQYAQASVQTLNPFPDYRDLYLIIAGVIVGLLLSGAVLGNLAPSWYEHMFVGDVAELREDLNELKAEQREQLRNLEGTGVTRAAVQEKLAQFEAETNVLRQKIVAAQKAHQRSLLDRMTALVLAILAVMVLEAIVSPPPQRGAVLVPRAVSRLVTVRYALISVWIAMAVAQPAILRGVPMVFTALVIIVALVIAFIPLGKRAEDEPQAGAG